MSASKGDRVRLTLRLPRDLVKRIDAAASFDDRNGRIERLLWIGLAEVAPAPKAPPAD
jgi:hypothetical protein